MDLSNPQSAVIFTTLCLLAILPIILFLVIGTIAGVGGQKERFEKYQSQRDKEQDAGGGYAKSAEAMGEARDNENNNRNMRNGHTEYTGGGWDILTSVSSASNKELHNLEAEKKRLMSELGLKE